MGVKDEEPKRPPKKLLYYYGIILLITVLLNALVLPKIAEKAVVKVSYDSFLEMVDQGKVEGVVRGDDQMQFWLKGSLTEEGRLKPGEVIYKTGLWPDEKLTDRLLERGVTFESQIPTKATPLQNFIFNWVLPIIMFVVLGQLLSRMMMKRIDVYKRQCPYW